jgi:cell division protease FtsH
MPVDHNRDRNSPSSSSPPMGNSILWFLLLLLLLNLLGVPFLTSRTTEEVPYSQFRHQVKQGLVDKAWIGPDKVRYTLAGEVDVEASANTQPTDTETPSFVPADGQTVYTTTPLPSDPDLVALLETQNVQYSGLPEAPKGSFGILFWLLMPLFFVGLWIWMASQNEGGGGPAALTVSKSKARIYSEGHTGVTFDDVAGVDEAKAELQEIIEFLRQPEKYIHIGAKIPKGVLLVGPPGTGKTLLAKAVAGEANVPFYSISGSEFVELFVGVGAARVRDLFHESKQHAPCIVFIDELDALGKSRGAGNLLGRNDEQEQTLNQLLTEMDGFEPNSGVLLLAATNRPEVLDPALLRPGRFDRQVLVDRPDKLGREAILKVHVRSVKLASDVDLTAIAGRTSGFTGADLANLVNEAALLTARNSRRQVTMADFAEAFERVVAGLEKKSRVLNTLEKTTIAHHEVGHAIVGSLMPGGQKVEKISIIPRGAVALGYTLQLPEEDRFLMLEDEIRGRLATLLAGRSAEEIILGKVSTGASDDLQKATDLAERAVTLYGMSPRLGPVAIDKSQPTFLETWQSPRRTIGQETAQEIDREVKRMLTDAHQAALAILTFNLPILKEAARHLFQAEVLEGKDLQGYLERIALPPELGSWLQTGDMITRTADTPWPNPPVRRECGATAAEWQKL